MGEEWLVLDTLIETAEGSLSARVLPFYESGMGVSCAFQQGVGDALIALIALSMTPHPRLFAWVCGWSCAESDSTISPVPYEIN